MKKKVLIKDIAEAAGVSSALVSYVLNNKAEEARVSAKTAKRISKIAKEMHYQPNQVAKSLKSGKSFSIGLIVTDISNPFFGRLARLIENESNKAGYTVLFGSSDENAERSRQLIDTLVNRQIDGIIIVPAEGSENQLKYLQEINIPFVLLDRYFEDIESSYVVIDNFKATYQATKLLVNRGYENIGFVQYDHELKHTMDRFLGYKKALEEEKKYKKGKFVCKVGYDDYASFKKEFKILIDKGVEAILFSTNTLSIRGLKTLKKEKIKVPEEVDVFCFDQNVSYDLFYYPIDYVKQPLDLIAHEAVRLLLGKVYKEKDYLEKIVLNPEIIKSN